MQTVRLVVGQGFQWLVVLVHAGDAHGLGSLCSRKDFKQLVPVYTDLGLYDRRYCRTGCCQFTKRQDGEFEFWFALIKVIAIVVFLVIGSLAIMHLWRNPAASGISNLTSQGFCQMAVRQ